MPWDERAPGSRLHLTFQSAQAALPLYAWLVIWLNCDASANGELTTSQGCPTFVSKLFLILRSVLLQPFPIGLALYPRATEHVYILFHTAALNLPGNGVICVPLAFLSKQSIVLRHHDFQTGPIQAASISPPFHFQYVTPKVKQNTLLRLPSRDC